MAEESSNRDLIDEAKSVGDCRIGPRLGESRPRTGSQPCTTRHLLRNMPSNDGMLENRRELKETELKETELKLSAAFFRQFFSPLDSKVLWVRLVWVDCFHPCQVGLRSFV